MFFCTMIKKNLFQTKGTVNHPVPFEVLMIVINAKSGADAISTDQNVKIRVIIDFIYQVYVQIFWEYIRHRIFYFVLAWSTHIAVNHIFYGLLYIHCKMCVFFV